ncbi:MAG: ATPase [Alphaproteobacteria bacterium]|nr:ATPase [Alphaproteobacteria bacterium]
MSEARRAPRRPYDTVSVAPGEKGYRILLDAKPLKSPAGTLLEASTAALAEAIATEWRAQPAKLDLGKAPLTRLLGTTLDRVTARRADIEAEVAGYAETELVCHRAERPAKLVQRQAALWQPLLEWFARRYDAPLAITHGVVAVEQPATSLAAIRRALGALDAFALMGLSLAVGAAGSLVIGAALADGHVDVETAFAAAELDATFQIEQWGEDAEAARRRATVRDDLTLAARWRDLIAG